MKKLFATLVFLCAGYVICAQENLNVSSYWQFNGDVSNALYTHISSVGLRQLKERAAHVENLKTVAEWTQRQADVRKMLDEMVGEFPEKTPLRPVITGRLKREGFVVEKLYFESLPGFHVTAALFIPSVKKGKLPAILYCSGHSETGFRDAAYQQCILNLVKKGFIVLAIDPIGQGERIQYFDAAGKSIFKSTFEHSYPGTQLFVAGRSLIHYCVWDGIRSIDYLLSRKEVDAKRIGITGRSGGGTQAAFIAALDDRIVAAAPECYITTFDKLLRSRGPQDAEQNMMHALAKGFDMGDLLEVRAPKPTLMVTTTQDIFSIQGARDVFREARNVYTAMGVAGNLQMVEDDAGHTSTKKNREATHAFFQKYLNHPGDPKDEVVDLIAEQELWATQSGQVITSLKGETLFSLNIRYADELVEHLQLKRKNRPNFYATVAQKARLLTGYSEPAPSKDCIFSGRLWRDGYSIEKYLLKGPGSYYISVLRLSPKTTNGKNILLLDDRGKTTAVAEQGGLADKLARAGYSVVVPDLNGFGEASGGYKGGDANIHEVPLNVWYAGILTNKSPLAVRVEEIKIITDFMRDAGAPEHITGIARGTVSTDLLHAAVICNAFGKIALINPLYSWQSIVREKYYHPKFVMSAAAGAIEEYDLPDVIAALSPAEVYMMNPVNALDQMINSDVFEQTFTLGDLRNLKVCFEEKEKETELIKQWIEEN